MKQEPKASVKAEPGVENKTREGTSTDARAPEKAVVKSEIVKSEPKAETKDRKLTKEEMERKVLTYMQQQNRPYNAQNVFDNLHGVVPKGQVQAMLEALAAAGKLLEKEYGKSKTYLAAQAAAVPEALEEQARALESEVSAAEAALREAKARHDEAKRAAGVLRGRRAATEEAAAAAQEVAALEASLESMREAALANDAEGEVADLDMNEVHEAEEKFRVAVREWKRRKRLCMNVLLCFSERADVKVDKIVDRYGVDTDEDCDQQMPQLDPA